MLATAADATGLPGNTRLHDFAIYVDQSVDVSCAAAAGRAAAGSCGLSRPMEGNSIFSPGGNGLTVTGNVAGAAGTGAGWYVGNCAIAMPAVTGGGGNGLRVAELENLAIATVGVDPLAAYAQADSTHTCGIYRPGWDGHDSAAQDRGDYRGGGTGTEAHGAGVSIWAGFFRRRRRPSVRLLLKRWG